MSPPDSQIDYNEKSPVEPASPSSRTTTLVASPSKTTSDPESGRTAPSRRPWLCRWLFEDSKADVEQQTSSGKEAEENEQDPYAVKTVGLHDTPTGFPYVANFQSSDRNFLQYRGFGTLHCRLLSVWQNEVQNLENELDELDRWDRDHDRSKLDSIEEDECDSPQALKQGYYPSYVKRTRPQLLGELREKILQYDELLLRTRDIQSLPRPAKRDYESVRTFFRDEQPVIQPEDRWVCRKEDIVTLRSGRETAGFDGFVEQCLTRLDSFFRKRLRLHIVQNIFLTPELREKCKNRDVDYFSPARIDTLVNVLITAVIFILLVLPVVVMYEVTSIAARQSALDAMGVLVVFTLIFGMAVSALTTAKRHELFAASAAYCAVLVVFIGNFAGNGGQHPVA